MTILPTNFCLKGGSIISWGPYTLLLQWSLSFYEKFNRKLVGPLREEVVARSPKTATASQQQQVAARSTYLRSTPRDPLLKIVWIPRGPIIDS